MHLDFVRHQPVSMPLVAQSILLGVNVRVGLEDNLYLSRGVYQQRATRAESSARSSRHLVRRVMSPPMLRETENRMNGVSIFRTEVALSGLTTTGTFGMRITVYRQWRLSLWIVLGLDEGYRSLNDALVHFGNAYSISFGGVNKTDVVEVTVRTLHGS